MKSLSNIWKLVFSSALISLVSGLQPCQSQSSGEASYFGSSDLFGGNYWGVDLQFSYIAKSQISLSSGVRWGTRKAQNLPSDYALSFGDFFMAVVTLGIDGGAPREEFTSYYALAGYAFPVGQSGLVRFNPQAGVAYTRRIEAVSFTRIQTFSSGESTYTTFFDDSYHLGIVLSPKLEFPVSNWIGFHITPVGQFSGEFNLYSIQMGLILGKL